MFTLTKLTPPPPVLLFNLTICLCFSLPVQAKIIQRKMHMVCQEHESAYWNGSKGVCCDKSIKQVANENRYACCEEWQNAYLYNNAVVCCNEDPNTTPNNLCCTKQNEKAYTYDYWYEVIFGSGSTGIIETRTSCCVNNPVDVLDFEDGNRRQYGVCCPSEKPYIALSIKGKDPYTGPYQKYACFECPHPVILEETSGPYGEEKTTYGCP